MDGVVSPATAIEIGRLGGLGVLNLEGLWTRYDDPTPLFDEIRELPAEKATARMQQMYAEPVQLELVTERIREMKAAGITTAASVTPQKTELFAPALLAPSWTSWSSRGPWSRPSTSRRRWSRSTSSGSSASSRSRDRRRLRLLPGRPAPDAYRCGRRAGRCGPGQRLHHPRGARHRRAPGHRHRRRGRRPHAPPRRDRCVLPRDRRRRHVQGWRHRQGGGLRRGRGHDRLAALLGGRGAGPGLPLGHGHLPPDPAPRRPGQDHSVAPSRRSCSGRPTRTTAA